MKKTFGRNGVDQFVVEYVVEPYNNFVAISLCSIFHHTVPVHMFICYLVNFTHLK